MHTQLFRRNRIVNRTSKTPFKGPAILTGRTTRSMSTCVVRSVQVRRVAQVLTLLIIPGLVLTTGHAACPGITSRAAAADIGGVRAIRSRWLAIVRARAGQTTVLLLVGQPPVQRNPDARPGAGWDTGDGFGCVAQVLVPVMPGACVVLDLVRCRCLALTGTGHAWCMCTVQLALWRGATGSATTMVAWLFLGKSGGYCFL